MQNKVIVWGERFKKMDPIEAKQKNKLLLHVWLIVTIMVIQLLIPAAAMAIDTTPPSWVEAPYKSAMTQTAGKISVKTDESGRVYCVVLPANSPEPLPAEVKAGTGKGGVAAVFSGSLDVAANTSAFIDITGLTDIRLYDAYVVAEDSTGNLQQTPFRVRISTSIIAYFNFEGSLLDKSGNSNDGTGSGVTYTQNGFTGQALSLNGSNYVKLPYRLLQSNSTFTVTMRFKTTVGGSLLGYQNIPAGGSGLTQYIPIIYIDRNGILRAELWIGYGVEQGGHSLAVTTGRVVTDNKWHKVTMTATSGSISIYVDDQSPITNTGTVNPWQMYYNQIGLAYNDAPPSPRNAKVSSGAGLDYYTGLIDDVYILSEGIDQTQVENLTSDAPKANDIYVVNGTGSTDTVTVAGLSPDDVVYFYNASTGGTRLGTAAVPSGSAEAVVSGLDLGPDSGNIYVSVVKAGGSESPRTEVPYLSESAQAANDSIAQAKAKLPDNFTATHGVDTNVLTYLNAISGMSDTGVILSLASYNANVAGNGDISYTGSSVNGNVLVLINKTDGIQDSKMISVTIPAVAADDPIITSDPVSKTVNVGETATFSISAETLGEGTLSYQWQIDSGSGFTDITGAESPAYTTDTLSIEDDGNSYRCIVTNTISESVSSLASAHAALTVNRLPGEITITSDPSKPYDGTPAEDPTISRNGTGDVTYSYYCDNGGVVGAALPGAPSDAGTYWVKVQMAQDANCTSAEDFRIFTISLAADTDGDGVIDLIDTDDDNDGFPDQKDKFPLDGKKVNGVDTDGDGIDDLIDTDDDNDGVLDKDENRSSFKMIQVSISGSGKALDGSLAYVYKGNDYTLTLIPNEGYYLSSVSVNGFAEKIDGNSVVLKDVTHDLIIDVEFSKIVTGTEMPPKSGDAPSIAGYLMFTFAALALLIYCINARRIRLNQK